MNTILITGANRGIGHQLTKNYLAAGWHVIACCRDPKQADGLQKLKTAHPNQLNIQALDVGNEKEIQNLSMQLKNQPIDILFNNAGLLGKEAGKLGDIKQSVCEEVLKINITAPLLMVQAFLKQVTQSQRKIIVNMSSHLASISLNDIGNHYVYRASKAGVNALTKSLSVDLKTAGVTVVSLDPGWVKTDMGGAEALLTPEESVAGLQNVLKNLSLNDTGSFISYDGKKVSW